MPIIGDLIVRYLESSSFLALVSSAAAAGAGAAGAVGVDAKGAGSNGDFNVVRFQFYFAGSRSRHKLN